MVILLFTHLPLAALWLQQRLQT